MKLNELDQYKTVQSLAKQVLTEIISYIRPGLTEADIQTECIRLFKKLGIDESWYHNVMAVVLVGERTTLSISGRKYKADNVLRIQSDDLITIDVSPAYQGYWGDCARSYILNENKVFLDEISGLDELDRGVQAEKNLHEFLKKIASLDSKPAISTIESFKLTLSLSALPK